MKHPTHNRLPDPPASNPADEAYDARGLARDDLRFSINALLCDGVGSVPKTIMTALTAISPTTPLGEAIDIAIDITIENLESGRLPGLAEELAVGMSKWV